jgi:hypothetical protein
MNKYIVTSSKFSGEIQLLYGPDGRLLVIDFLHCDLNDVQIDYFKRHVPISYTEDTFKSSFGKSELSVIREGFRVEFEQFWDRYNQKHNRERCLKLWSKLSEAEKVKAYYGLVAYERHLSLNTWKSKADPDTYLRNKLWQNQWK